MLTNPNVSPKRCILYGLMVALTQPRVSSCLSDKLLFPMNCFQYHTATAAVPFPQKRCVEVLIYTNEW